MGRRRRPRRLRVRFGNYPREISGRRGGRYTQISAQAKAEAADLFVVGSGASTDEETGETEGAVILRRLREGNSRASSDALISDAVVLDDALNTREELERFSELCRARGVERCVEINQCVGCHPGSVERRGTGIATPSSRRRIDGVEVDAKIQHERAVNFDFHTGGSGAASTDGGAGGLLPTILLSSCSEPSSSTRGRTRTATVFWTATSLLK